MRKDVRKQKKEVKVNQLNSDIREALLKKALGYSVSEVSEEYGMVGDKLQVIKKKINTKIYPPDLDAIELALGDTSDNDDQMYSNYTDEELLEEKNNLIDLFKRIRKENGSESN